MDTMLQLTVTGVDVNEFRTNGSTVYANFLVHLTRPDGVPVDSRAQDWQLDLSKYPDMKAHVDALLPLITNAYLFEAQMAADPQQAYVPPPAPDPAPTDPAM